jgi:hypothetical protein
MCEGADVLLREEEVSHGAVVGVLAVGELEAHRPAALAVIVGAHHVPIGEGILL